MKRQATVFLLLLSLPGLAACVDQANDDTLDSGYGEQASVELIDACEGMCDQIIACTEEPYDTCTAECRTGAFVGQGAQPCVAEYTALIVCFDQPQCDFSLFAGEQSPVCTSEAEAYYACDLDHGISCGDRTVPNSWLCDGVEDCVDGMDERDC